MVATDSVLTLSDLDSWSEPGTWLAVLGHPIKHSISPVMHNAALAELAQTNPLYKDWHYTRFDVTPEDLPLALDRLRAKGFIGLNLTVPHKVIAFNTLSSAHISPAARPIGAVNTLFCQNGLWQGFNTDGYGLAAALREDLGLPLKDSHVILLGAGGAARGAAVECLQQGVGTLSIANRSAENLTTLLNDLAPLSTRREQLRGFSPQAIPGCFRPGMIVINATSAGLKPEDPAPIDLTRLPRPAAVYDMIYNPPRTPLLRQAEALKIPFSNGLSMLIHQGAKALSLWTGVPASELAPTMSNAARAKLKP